MTPSIVLSEVLDALTELSDRDMQERLWVHGGEDGISSFTEAICGVFDDGGVSRAMDAGQLDASTTGLFRKLDRLIDRIPEEAPPQDVIDHPAMEDVRRVSKELLGILG